MRTSLLCIQSSPNPSFDKAGLVADLGLRATPWGISAGALGISAGALGISASLWVSLYILPRVRLGARLYPLLPRVGFSPRHYPQRSWCSNGAQHSPRHYPQRSWRSIGAQYIPHPPPLAPWETRPQSRATPFARVRSRCTLA